jgi:hypothetical protein
MTFYMADLIAQPTLAPVTVAAGLRRFAHQQRREFSFDSLNSLKTVEAAKGYLTKPGCW